MILIFTDISLLTFPAVITIILLFQNLSDWILMQIPVSIHFTEEILTALSRIQSFLERPDDIDVTINANRHREIGGTKLEKMTTEDKRASRKASCTPYIWLNNFSCKLPKLDDSLPLENGTFLLQNIYFKIKSKGLVIITGSVGCGKSSLLTSILDGERAVSKGSLQHSGIIAYVSETPWIFSATIRENILFGSPFNEEFYSETIKACQLEKDFRTLPEQDFSHIGEHGAALSGGQRTRIALARAVYSRADIYLLDDPLSSLDPKVAEIIFWGVLKGMLSEKIVLLVAHKYFNEADYIVKLDKGKNIYELTH